MSTKTKRQHKADYTNTPKTCSGLHIRLQSLKQSYLCSLILEQHVIHQGKPHLEQCEINHYNNASLIVNPRRHHLF